MLDVYFSLAREIQLIPLTRSPSWVLQAQAVFGILLL